MGEELIRIMLKRDEVEVEHARGVDFQKNQKYKKIVSSIRNIGLIEALSVYWDGSYYILLDGYLRLKAAEELGIDQVPCFIYQNRDSYTFNAMRNELSPLQQSKMIKKAISHGVDEKDLAAVLNVKVDRIRQTKKLVDSLIPEAKELLDKNRIFRSAAEQLTRVKEERQRVILKKMDEVGNYNASYAKVLVMKTPDGMMRNGRALRRNSNPEPSQKSLFTQIRKGDEEIEFYAQRYKENMKELMKQVVFFRSLLERDATSEYLSVNYSHMVLEVKKILTRSETEVLS
jgi:ParB-like chromosome segregation protein Spo0J